MVSEPLIKLLFGNHKFWKKTKKKLNAENGLLLGSCLLKNRTAAVNLTDLYKYCKYTHLPFEDVFAKDIAHEIFHILVNDEVKFSTSEELVLSKIFGLPYT